jgi:hypothetical protein
MSTLDDYLFQVGKAASQFQFLEEGLKMYLAECFDIVRENVKGKIEFRYVYKDLKNKSLGPLVRLFAKYATSEELTSSQGAF